MTVNILDLVTRDALFLSIGKSIGTALATTIPDKVTSALQGLGEILPTEYEKMRDGVFDGQQALQSAGAGAIAALVQSPVQNDFLLTVSDDTPAASTLDLAIREFIKQMEDTAEYLDASTVSASVSYDSGNIGTGKLVASVKRADGKYCQLAFAEDVDFLVSSVADGVASFSGGGAPAIDSLSPLWPGGSGASASVTGRRASSGSNLVTNGTFEENDDNSSHLPEGWLAPTATLGTTLKMGSVEVQTVAITGTPTGGFYVLNWTNAAGKAQTTAPLAYNATETDVQTALQALVGLGDVTVSTSGTAPDYTHTVTFTGVPGPAEMTSTNSLTGGSSPTVSHATTTAGSSNVFRGARAVEFDSNGSQLTTIMVPVTVAALAQYACNLFAKVDSVPAAGVLTVDLVDGVGGSVINDQAGTANSFTFSATALTTSWAAQNGVFRIPAVLPPIVYLRIRITTAVSNTSSVFLDEVYLGLMDEIYTDGLSVAIFDGATDWIADDQVTVTVSQDYEGEILHWLDRIFGLRQARLMPPTKTDGSETLVDALIA